MPKITKWPNVITGHIHVNELNKHCQKIVIHMFTCDKYSVSSDKQMLIVIVLHIC